MHYIYFLPCHTNNAWIIIIIFFVVVLCCVIFDNLVFHPNIESNAQVHREHSVKCWTIELTSSNDTNFYAFDSKHLHFSFSLITMVLVITTASFLQVGQSSGEIDNVEEPLVSVEFKNSENFSARAAILP